jgi:23S rRNA (guanosine2251-2'-O)-methyltransferase
MPPKHKRHKAPSLPQRDAKPQRPHEPKPARDTSGSYWLYGWHAVNAALANPERPVRRILVSEAGESRLKLPRKLVEPQTLPAREMDNLLGRDAVHQGIAALVAPLPTYVLEDVVHLPKGPLLVLDQVSDPHNVGAILRSAAAFGAVGVIHPKDHSAPESAVMAKAACGGLDMVRRIAVTNLASALRDLKDAGWWVIGLDGEAKSNLAQIKPSEKMVLVLGAEGRGMRRLTAELCDELAKLPMDPRMESLNVSNAAAISLYHLFASTHG